MSYHQDHLAWQQRVGLEMHAHRKNLDKVLAGQAVYPSNSLYEFYQSILAEQQQARTPNSTQQPQQPQRPSSSVFNPQNKHAYTFGGKTNVRSAQKGTNPVLAQQAVINDYQLQQRSSGRRREDDAMSKSSSAYVGRSQRHMSASAASKPSGATRTYYPEQYFQRVGYTGGKQGGAASDQLSHRSQASRGSRRVDALGQRVRERFNEDLEYPAEAKKTLGLRARNLPKTGDADSQVLSRRTGETQSRVQSAIVSRRQAQAIARVANSSAIKEDKSGGDQESVITRDNLKQFNHAQGTVAGNSNEILEEAQAELLDHVDDLEIGNEQVLSQAPSKFSNKTYIMSLENQLNEEKLARLVLEEEIAEIKKINQEISSKLALTSNHSDMK